MRQETLEELIIININGKSETVTRRHAIELILDSDEFKKDLYKGLDEQKRIELGQFYTPAKICIQMIEKFNTNDLAGKPILDPACGSGNLLIACLIAGADYDKLYGNEYDAVAVELCRKRINRACDILGKPHIPYYHIHQGNALQVRCLTCFDDKPEESYLLPDSQNRTYQAKYIDDLEYAQTYEHDVEEELLGEIFTRHESAMSWRWENEHAAARAAMAAKKKAADEAKHKIEVPAEQQNLFDL